MNRLIFNQDNCIRFYTKQEKAMKNLVLNKKNIESKIASYDRELRNIFLNFKEANILTKVSVVPI